MIRRPPTRTHLQAFLDRWELTQLATWDLPCVQGPLFPNPFPAGAPAVPIQGVHNIVPMHFPLRGNDDFQREIERQQRRLARDKGIAESLASVAHFEAYAQIFQVRYYEQIILRRYGSLPRPKGFMTRLQVALAAALDCSEESIRKFRNAIARCLRGMRSSVPWLRPRTR